MAGDYFSGLGFQADPNLHKRNDQIRTFLKAHPKVTAKTTRGKRLRTELASNKASANPIDATTGQTVRSEDAAALNATRLKYGTSRSTALSQVANVNQQLQDLDPYFQQYEQHVNAIGVDSVNTANQQQAAIIAQNQQAAQQGQQGAQAIAARAGDNPAAQEGLQAQDAAAQGRAALAQNSANAIAERGAIRGDEFKALAANGALAENETRGKLNANLTTAQNNLSNLDQQIGDYFSSTKQTNQAAALDAALKQQALKLQGVKFKASQANVAADNARADQALTDAEQKTAQQQQNVAAGLNPNGTPIKTTTPKGSNVRGGRTPTQRVDLKSKASTELATDQGLVVHAGQKGGPPVPKAGVYKGQKIPFLKVPTTKTNVKKNGATNTVQNYKYIALTGKNRQQIFNHMVTVVGDRTVAGALSDQMIYKHVNDATWKAVEKLGLNPAGLGLSRKGK